MRYPYEVSLPPAFMFTNRVYACRAHAPASPSFVIGQIDVACGPET